MWRPSSVSASRRLARLLVGAQPQGNYRTSVLFKACGMPRGFCTSNFSCIDGFSSTEAQAAIEAAFESGDYARADMWLTRAKSAKLAVEATWLDDYNNCNMAASGIVSNESRPSGLSLNEASPAQPQPAAKVRELWSRLFADGVTPYLGTVKAVRNYGAVILLDVGYQGLVAQSEISSASLSTPAGPTGTPLSRGERVTAYIVKKNKDSGKLSLCLAPRDIQVRPLKAMIVDGRHPYPGIVTSSTPYGLFVDVGFERQAFVSMENVEASVSKSSKTPGPGDSLTVYVVRLDAKSGRVVAELEPRVTPLLLWKDAIGDGQTAYHGTVDGMLEDGSALVDFGCQSLALLDIELARTAQEKQKMKSLQEGAKVTVYIVGKDRALKRLFVCLHPLPQPLNLWDDIAADGQTPYIARVARHLECGHYLLDIGCETLGMLPAQDEKAAQKTLHVGDTVTVFVVSKRRSTGRVTVSTVRRKRPLERYSAVVADGVTPYNGLVETVSVHGLFVDIGCELLGLLPGADLEQFHFSRLSISDATPSLASPLRQGDQVTVYVWYKHAGKLELSLHPRKNPAINLEDLKADGVTPVTGTVLGHRDAGAWFDIGVDVLALLSRWDDFAEKDRIARLQPGEAVTVYVHRRNLVTRHISLSLTPASTPRLKAADVVGGGQIEYDGVVAKIARGLAFVDFHCEVTGFLPEVIEPGAMWTPGVDKHEDARIVLQAGDCIQVRASEYDISSGRWRLAFASRLDSSSREPQALANGQMHERTSNVPSSISRFQSAAQGKSEFASADISN